MSSANRVRRAYVPEVTFGVTPPTPAFVTTRFTGGSFKQTTQTARSTEIRSDRQTSTVKRVSVQADGSNNIEMPYGEHDAMLQALLQSAGWSSPVTVGPSTAISAAASDKSFNGTGLFGAVVVGQWVRVIGFAAAANNGYFKVVTAASGKITVSGGTTGALVDEAAGASVKIVMGAQIIQGTTQPSFTFEDTMQDLSNVFIRTPGSTLNTGSLSIAVAAMITGSFNFVGVKQVTDTAIITGATYSTPTTTESMAAVDEVYSINEDGLPLEVTGLDFSVTNNLRPRNVVARVGPKSFGQGSIVPSGSVTMYFDDKIALDKYLAFASGQIAIALDDRVGNGYIVEFPRVKFTDGDHAVPGINTDIMLKRNFEAFMHQTELVTVRIARFPGP